MTDSRKDTDYEPGSPLAAELWRRARAGAGPAAAPEVPDSLTIAAYVDGTLEASARDRVEAWMAAVPEAVDLIAAARSVPEAPLPAAPAALLARARGLVRDRAAPAKSAAGGMSAWFSGMALPSAWAAAAAVLLLAAVIGFEAGQVTTVGLDPTLTVAADENIDFGPTTDDLL